MKCVLCESVGNKIKPTAIIRKCLNPLCEIVYFYATSKEMIYYYDNFLKKLLQKDMYIVPEKVYQSLEYRRAWEYFIKEIFFTRSIIEIVNLSYLYLHGIGVKKSLPISNSLIIYAKMIHSDGEVVEPCPVCITNPPDYGELCSKCGYVICEYCYSRLSYKLCPCCRNSYLLPFNEKMSNLVILTERFRNTAKSNQIKFGTAKLLIMNNHKKEAISLATELVSRGYKPSISLLRDNKKMLELGRIFLEKQSLRILARLQMIKRNVNKGIYYYVLAIGRGDFLSLLTLDRLI